MAAISTPAIAAPVPSAAPAKSNANTAASGDNPSFASQLASANGQQAAPASVASANSSSTASSSANSDKSDTASSAADDTTNSSAQTAAATAGAAQPASGAAQAQLQAEADAADDADTVQDGAQTDSQIGGKPAPKTGKTANDNQAAQASATQAQPAQPDPNLIAMASQLPAAPAQPQPAVANDEGDDGEETGAVGATGKAGAKSASATQGQTDTAAAAASDAATNPAAAAQAAIRGANGNGNSNNPSGNSPDSASGDNVAGAEKSTTKPADSNSAPQVQPQQPQQPQAPQAPAMAASAVPAAANGMPVQTTGATHNFTASVQVAPQTAAAPTLGSLAVDIAARSQSGAKQFQIRLDPPELGRVDVRLSIDATGKTEAHLTADQPETLNLLQKDSSTLTQALRDSGLDVSQNGLNFSLRGQNSQAGNDQSGNGGQAHRSSLTASRVLDAAQSASSISFTGGADQTRLDIHV